MQLRDLKGVAPMFVYQAPGVVLSSCMMVVVMWTVAVMTVTCLSINQIVWAYFLLPSLKNPIPTLNPWCFSFCSETLNWCFLELSFEEFYSKISTAEMSTTSECPTLLCSSFSLPLSSPPPPMSRLWRHGGS